MIDTVEERPGPETCAYAGEFGSVLDAAIGRLPHGQRLVFVMRHHEGLKLGEIAAALGLAEGTVKRQLHAAVHRLRAALRAANVTVGGRRMSACRIQADGLVELYFYDELPTAERADVVRHLPPCAECRAALDELHTIRACSRPIAHAVAAPPGSDWSALMARHRSRSRGRARAPAAGGRSVGTRATRTSPGRDARRDRGAG